MIVSRVSSLPVPRVLARAVSIGGMALACWLVAFQPLVAQTNFLDEPEKDTIATAVLPAIAYSSDLGLLGGLIFNRHDYTGNVKPFNNHMASIAIFSTKGYIESYVAFDNTNTLNTDWRTYYELYLNRIFKNNYFGIGNLTTFDENRWDNDFYFFESLDFGVDIKGRKPLYRSGENQRLDLLVLLGAAYQNSYVRDDTSSFALDPPPGSEGGKLNYIGTGFIWENRDNEFDPHRGNRVELELKYAPSFLFSDFEMGKLQFEARQYKSFQLGREITLAGRVRFIHTVGDVPYWEMPVLGETKNMRGYPLNRFMGKSSVVYTLEARSWLIDLPYNSRFGVHAFTDAGRVFTEDDDINQFFQDNKQTFGVGVAASLLNPDFILRAELGISDEITRFYVGIGYTF